MKAALCLSLAEPLFFHIALPGGAAEQKRRGGEHGCGPVLWQSPGTSRANTQSQSETPVMSLAPPHEQGSP